jgi:hypothetical protein
MDRINLIKDLPLKKKTEIYNLLREYELRVGEKIEYFPEQLGSGI